MNNELQDFIYFKEKQLHSVDFNTGKLDTTATKINHYGYPYTQIRKNVGSKNQDGYIRVWCNNTLRMKHRLLYFLYYNELPIEIDHINGIRNDNSITNLRSVDRKEQLSNLHSIRQKGIRYKLSVNQVEQICSKLLLGETCTQLSKDYNVSRNCISDIKNKRRWLKISNKYF
ncbi:HNH endonuclease [Campylobacter fetus]|uniref:HNH endonuclease n=1 Tax=Campylobacter fetus TaxID=196 RepID=UPI0008187618|nr:HNH endonuclease [Campylobacter fetus]